MALVFHCLVNPPPGACDSRPHSQVCVLRRCSPYNCSSFPYRTAALSRAGRFRFVRLTSRTLPCYYTKPRNSVRACDFRRTRACDLF